MNQNISSWQTDDEIIAILGTRVQARRIQNDFTQDELAQETGLSTLTIHNIENGKGSKLESFIRILRFFAELDKLDQILSPQNVSPKELFENRNKPLRKRARKKHD